MYVSGLPITAFAGISAETSDSPAIIIDAAMLFEANWDDLCTDIIFVDAPQENATTLIRHGGATSPGIDQGNGAYHGQSLNRGRESSSSESDLRQCASSRPHSS